MQSLRTFIADNHFLVTVLWYAVLAALVIYLARQVRRPSRWTGQFFAQLMNLSHSGLANWGLQHVTIGPRFSILDVGCGGGRTIRKLAALAPEGTIHGIDYGNGSVAAARMTNAALIAAGRVAIEYGSVSALPFADDSFDLVTASETTYYWPDLVNDMRGVRRVLKPGGTFLIILESYRTGAFDWLQRPIMRALGSAPLGMDDYRDRLTQAGFSDVQVFEKPGRSGMCALGRK
ncbi:MAG: class I SAM-dependent methyltransferase [Rhizomicrobium sp.]